MGSWLTMGYLRLRAFLSGAAIRASWSTLVAAGLLLPRLKEHAFLLKQAEAERERLLEQLGRQMAENRRLVEQMERRVCERTHHLKTLYDVTTVVSECLDLRLMLRRSLDRIVTAVDGEFGVVHLIDPRDGSLRVVAPEGFSDEPCRGPVPSMEGSPTWSGCRTCSDGEPPVAAITAEEGRTDPAFSRLGARAHVGLPIRCKGQVAGVLCLFRSPHRPFGAKEIALLMAVGERIGAAIEHLRLFGEVQDRATLEERHRLASELHDSVTQLIYSEMLLAEAARHMVTSGKAVDAVQYLERLGETAQQALKEMRLLLYELRPLGPAGKGLAVALQRRLDAVERRAGLDVQLHVEGLIQLPSPVEEGLYRIAQEALNNALKHAGATSVTIDLRGGPEIVVMSILDDGRGFDPGAAADHGGLGFTTMRERAAQLCGSLVIESSPGAGTAVRARIPLIQGSSCSPGDSEAPSPIDASGVSR